ncbi:MAG: hypothetical protein ACE5FZ_03210 [Nitrospiria bacterium]
MKQMRIIMGTLLFASLMVGTIPAQAKTDPVTGMRVVKPYFFPTGGAEILSFAGFPANPVLVDPNKLKVKARLTFEPGVTYELFVNIFDVSGKDGMQSLYVIFNGGDSSSAYTAFKGKIVLLRSASESFSGGEDIVKSSVKIQSTGWSTDKDLMITVTLMPRGGTPISHTGYVRTSSR